MKKLFISILTAVALLSMAAIFTACNKTEELPKEDPIPQEEPVETPEEIPDDNSFEVGSIVNGIYSNRWASISFEVPADTQPLTESEMLTLLADTGKTLAGEDAQAQLEMNTFIKEGLIPLFIVNDTKESSTLKIQFVAEYTQDINSPQAYLERTLEQLQQTDSTVKFSGEPATANLGGQEYTRAALSFGNGSTTVEYYVRQMEDCFLVLSVGYTMDRGEEVYTWIANIQPPVR